MKCHGFGEMKSEVVTEDHYYFDNFAEDHYSLGDFAEDHYYFHDFAEDHYWLRRITSVFSYASKDDVCRCHT
jgi:hypothetical protein